MSEPRHLALLQLLVAHPAGSRVRFRRLARPAKLLSVARVAAKTPGLSVRLPVSPCAGQESAERQCQSLVTSRCYNYWLLILQVLACDFGAFPARRSF